ncbi:HAMP domain-containing histidine kinase [Algoriphagus aestuariicola]|jgi:signal transduction histidine kinase|uniref:histidine kinase n=1 Tax=Algoriphagus aestuariicola TaxID=1852016 RepID=A0ABS3BRL0_9BACT|nr:HAMP domain-containing sensor histidine kinase [Algoriphagus aestuariicola]MBN7801866.1 HAMP domain-containing histidine kinase [Algoriphagus aestuariicola]
MRSLYWRISFSFILVLLLIGASYVYITASNAREYYQETTQKLNSEVAEYLIKEVNPFKDGKIDEEALGIIMHSMMAVNPSIEVYLLNPQGEILSYVVLDQLVKLKAIDIEPVKEFIASKGSKFILGDDPRNPGNTSVFSAAPIYEQGKLQGYVYITLESEKFDSISASLLGSYWFRLTMNSVLITLILGLLIGLVLIAWLTRHLRKVLTTVEEFKDGNMLARVPESSSDSDFAELGRTFNSMADTLVRNIEELKNVDTLRKELIANVSHDLRNPLAIINGYVETLQMRQDRLSLDEKAKYYKIILDSVDKLAKLVGDLFDLSKLESGQMPLKMERMKIQELIYDSSMKYELLAEAKEIQIRSNICPNLPPVTADLYLMDRVIQNLLDNAVKYTPSSGEIELEACEAPGGVLVRVKNSGTGIPKEDLDSIFDRYYKVDKEFKGIEGSGLGLAIVKKILEIHGSKIEISSDSESFTEFQFFLPS